MGMALKKRAGLSRISSINKLANQLMPVFQGYRPHSTIDISTCSGKGLTTELALASLLFEAYEIAVAERVRCQSIVLSSRKMVDSKMDHVPVGSLGQVGFCEDKAVEWIPVKDFDTDTWVYAPIASLYFHPGIFSATSNGLATGLSFYESLMYGLLEVVERHAHTWALLRKRAFSVRNYKSQISAELKDELLSLQEQGVQVEINDISTELGIPCFYSVFVEPTLDGMRSFNSGVACHLDKKTALESAISEALQSRAVSVSGSREDLNEKHSAIGDSRVFSFWYSSDSKEQRDFDDIISLTAISSLSAINLILETVRKNDKSLGRYLYYTYPSENGTYVTRSIIEGAEQFGLCRHRFGQSVFNYLKGSIG
ncbi:YcaO-like family protein [Pseudobacteriovorax antillogorgiicola]|uniref:YcaO-like family protein n=1 Tax=Pseudobacteriovorax antillogorgiicola TaxID=1513793 RepID=UPI0022866001|nr:YcaO-like family protein [Pseudobacteriovorax antillogorgiicola]